MVCAGMTIPATQISLWLWQCQQFPLWSAFPAVPLQGGSCRVPHTIVRWAGSTWPCPCFVPRLSVWCALSSYSSHSKVQASARQKKRHREDIEVCLGGAGAGLGLSVPKTSSGWGR